MARAVKLTLEPLEDRITPVAFGVSWPEASGLTLSFVPDGTSINGQFSNLFQMLDARMPTQVWQTEILRAFQTWAVAANINIGLVQDGGEPFGTLGLKEGDPRFGDIRIGAQQMGSDVLAVANPYDPFVANTWVGDVFLNSSASFTAGPQDGSYDLGSVLLHEAGHVFGIGHSDDPNSPMYPQFNEPHTKLTTADIAALQALYGQRKPDAFEGATGNDTFATASPLSFGSPDSPASAQIQADITTNQDADIYRISVPDVTSLDVKLNVAGVSLLVPRLTVYDASGHTVASALAPDPLNNNLSLHLDHLTPGAVYYVKVEAGTGDVFGIGAYNLEIDPHSPDSITPPPSSTGTTVPAASLANAQLLATTPWYVEHTYYEVVNSLTPAIPVRTYLVQSADLGPDMTNVMTVVAFSPENASTHYQVKILDDQGNPVAATVLVDAAGRLEVRVPNVHSAQNYYVQVQDADPLTQPTDFDVEVDFAQDATHLQTFVNQSLGSDQADYATTLQVLQSQEFHFVLSATDWSAPVETGVRMTIYNASGKAVFTTAVADGASRSVGVFLNAGQYMVRFTRANNQGSTPQPIVFELSGKTESDPLGPQLRDTTLGPVDSVTPAIEPSVTFFWLPFAPADLAARGVGNLIPTSAETIALGNSSDGARTQSSLLQPRTTGLPRSISLMDVVGLSIVQPVSLSAVAVPTDSSVWSLNSLSHQGSPLALPSAFHGEGVPIVNQNTVADSPSGNGRYLSPLSVSDVRLGWLPVDLEILHSELPNLRPPSFKVAGRTMANGPTEIVDEVETALPNASACPESKEALDLSLLGYLVRVMGLPGLILILFFPHMRSLSTAIPRLLRVARGFRHCDRQNSSEDRFSVSGPT
ncbi:MAG TPA: matrixin family metalloprotease [Gemmataceae bacterium]|jgi:hypothetical protein